MPDITFNGVPFEEAAKFFRDKVRLPTKAWTDLKEGQHARAFVVAGATKDDLLKDLQASIQSAIDKGTDLRQFRKDFDQIVARHGWTGWTGEGSKKGRAWRTKVIFETNMSTARAAGRWEQIQRVKKTRPWLRYVAILDTHVRPDHRRWHGTVLSVDDEWWNTHYPPNGWNCFPAGTSIRCEAKLGFRAWYRGEMVQLRTIFGHDLTVTANHPVLTRRGWVAAHLIEKGDELVGACGDVDALLPGIVDHKQPPARARDLFEALASKGLRVVPVTTDDFHGDALAMEGKVDVAGADGVLMDILQSAAGQLGGEGRFQHALHRRIESADVRMGAALVPPIAGDAILGERLTDARLGAAQTSPDRRRAGEAAAVKRQNLTLDAVVAAAGGIPRGGALPLDAASGRFDVHPLDALRLGSTAKSDTGATESAAESVAGAALLFGELLQAGTGAVACDQVLEVRKFQWAGHVYDFSTDTGLIVAGGIVVSNCRCTVMSLSKRQMDDFGYEPSRAPPAEQHVRREDPWGGGTLALDRGIDPGFNYNVGKAHVGLAREIPAGYAKTQAQWEPLEGGAYRSRTPADYGDAAPLVPKPAPVEPGKSAAGQAEMIDAVERAIDGPTATLTTPDGVAVHVDARFVGQHIDRQRAPFVPFLPDLVENPQEIWLAFERNTVTGQVALRRRHVAIYDTGDRDRPLMMVFQAHRGYFEAWTFLTSRTASYIERFRRGFRIWPTEGL